MDRHGKWISTTFTVLSIAAYSVAITCSAQAIPESKLFMKSMSPKASSKTPQPQDGIKLLDAILLRMHAMPMVAKNKMIYQYQPPVAQVAQDGPTIPMLAIKPPDNTNSYRDMVARAGDREYEKSEKKSSSNELRRKQSFGYAGGRGLRKEVLLDEDAKVKDFRAAPSEEAINVGGNVSVFGGYHSTPQSQSYSAGASGSQTVNVRGSLLKNTTESQQKAPAIPQQYSRLANSINKLYGITNGMTQQMQSAQAPVPTAAAEPSSRAEGFYSNNKSRRVQIGHSTVAAARAPGIWDKSQAAADALSTNSSAGAAGTAGDAAKSDLGISTLMLPPHNPASYRTITTIRPSTQSSILPPTNMGKFMNIPGDNQYTHSMFAQSSTKAKTEIAMLPPNVITGVPLVRLGSSAQDASRALSGCGTLKQQTINAPNNSVWTVLVLNKANSLEPAMHVYMKNGLVEALRVFDQSLVSPDFGVQLGDDLPAVKKKFGEPAFLISEPNSRSGQNYVYPISQVSFQIAIVNKAPKVVSLLIFTVK